MRPAKHAMFLKEVVMSTLTFDTHKFIKRLTEAGMPLNQAEVLADEQTKLIDERLATKDDLKMMELRLTMKLGALIAAGIGIVATISKLFH
ncbi:MAG: hypothetical protein Fur0026_14220 [Sideroxydans sp.]